MAPLNVVEIVRDDLSIKYIFLEFSQTNLGKYLRFPNGMNVNFIYLFGPVTDRGVILDKNIV